MDLILTIIFLAVWCGSSYIITSSLEWSRFGAVLGFTRGDTLFHAVLSIGGPINIICALAFFYRPRSEHWIAFKPRLLFGRHLPADSRFIEYYHD